MLRKRGSGVRPLDISAQRRSRFVGVFCIGNFTYINQVIDPANNVICLVR